MKHDDYEDWVNFLTQMGRMNRGSFPIITPADALRARNLMDKNNLPVSRRLPSVDIPKDMTPEHYYGMNLLPGHRIGEDYRQKYLDKLSELHVNGYITSEEFDKRADWVNAAQTREQIDIAFMDLQQAMMSLKTSEYLTIDKQVPSRKWLIGPVLVYVLILVCLITDIIGGSLSGVLLLGAELLILTSLIAYRAGKHGRS